uniref:Uncharacterized protein n=1 Tax=Ascaris lumbricoides TaxID=6252 RepID=A0A0M3HW11_ASCLU
MHKLAKLRRLHSQGTSDSNRTWAPVSDHTRMDWNSLATKQTLVKLKSWLPFLLLPLLGRVVSATTLVWRKIGVQ